MRVSLDHIGHAGAGTGPSQAPVPSRRASAGPAPPRRRDMGSLNRLPAGEALVEGADEVLVTDGDVLWHAEAPAGLQGHKAVEGSPHHTSGVHGVIARQAVPGEDCEDDLQYPPAQFRTLFLTWSRSCLLYTSRCV